ncbi:MATE family efflux transporter [Domibacillus epiphyticus]|uniref:Probable multidrug resistance protein NorM n=1 Tax=Domibacillus epiphyticus TaxID=1714355 RepID=A0A1V2A4A3_9BACI|nr:MATE family efflux transporter [Domibacillus epiphyticus]OMP65692.1 MATE family efflux transporter [Domibacillus epiphyticus]
MIETVTTGAKVRQFLYILVPILVTQIAMFSMTFFDTIMSGRYSAEDLAGVAVGSSLWLPVYTGLSGILMSITPIIGHLIGGGEQKKVSFSVMQGVYVALFIAAVTYVLGLLCLGPILGAMNLEENVRRIAFEYVIGLSFGIIPLFLTAVLRGFIDALGMTRTSMVITLLSLPLNVLFNYLLIYGKWGFPELGGVGSGYATAITYWIIFFLAVWIIHRHEPFSMYRLFHTLPKASFIKWKEIFLLGLPIGLSIFFETSIFSAVTLFMSEYNTNVIAAHQAALNFASLTYMIPLSVSMALTIVIGFEAGANRWKDARQYSLIGVSIAVSISLLCTAGIFFFREQVAYLYSTDSEVLKLTAGFLMFAALFQLSDAVQAPVQGALRGYKDVNVTFMMTMISYWVIGLPLGWALAAFTDSGPYGYWIGLIIGLTCGAITLSLRLRFVQKRKSALPA